MQNVSSPQDTATVIDRWWHDCSLTAITLPHEHNEEWLDLISKVVRYYRLMDHCTNPTDQKYYRRLCQHALAKSKWELMLLSIYGHISQQQLHSLERLQNDLERALEE
jgi:hypothetical protein